MVEPQIVVLVVAGSSPVGHPALHSQIASFNAMIFGLESGSPRRKLQESRLLWQTKTALVDGVDRARLNEVA
jgi:hypothetical protein